MTILKSYSKTLKFYNLYIGKMLIEKKQEVLEALIKKYALIRDDDWELLTILGRDNEWYYVYYLEHCNLTKSDVEALLDKAAWIAFAPIIDEKILRKNKEELGRQKEKIESQVENNYNDE